MPFQLRIRRTLLLPLESDLTKAALDRTLTPKKSGRDLPRTGISTVSPELLQSHRNC